MDTRKIMTCEEHKFKQFMEKCTNAVSCKYKSKRRAD